MNEVIQSLYDGVSKSMLEMVKRIRKDDWFKQLAIMADAFADEVDNQAEDACRWLIRNGVIPNCPRREFGFNWFFGRVVENGNVISTKSSEVSLPFYLEMKTIFRGMLTPNYGIRFLLFLAAWRRGFDPATNLHEMKRLSITNQLLDQSRPTTLGVLSQEIPVLEPSFIFRSDTV